MPALSIMIKPASSLCNLRCKYCFYCDVAAHRDVFSMGVMTEVTAEKLIKDALDFADGCSVAFAFQGGEPLIAGLDYFRFFTQKVKEYNRKNSEIFFSIQTNGTLVTDEWARFFRENEFLVGLSLDGDFAGNKFRVDAKGQNAYYKIVSAAGKLKKHGVEFNILTVLTGFCADNAERIYKHFRANGYGYIQFIPCLRPIGDSSESELYMTGEQYGEFLVRIFNLYVKDFVRGHYISVRQFDNYVRMYLGQKPEQCGLMGHCSHQFVAEGNGNIYPCDFYCTDEWLLGNIMDMTLEEMAKSKKAEDFIRESLAVPEKCKKCRFYPMCRAGGCKRNRESADYCASYKHFFSGCLPLFRVFAQGKK
ncbi:MAG: SPASM domain-containing protein [Oscillospiraceae bacterium]|nr:SPASM domain-containing protein [Oscillospiraceae bacterium]